MTVPNLLTAETLIQGLLNTPSLLASGEQSAYVVPVNKAVKIATASLCNTTASAVVVSISIAPSGGTPGVANRIVSSFSLAPNDSLTQEDGLSTLKGAMLGEGQTISVNAGTGSAVVLVLTGTVTG
jgi:hypothetical protein